MVSTDSRLLFQALDGVYGDLGFGALGDDVFRDLVLARVVEPTSILDTGRVLADLGRKAASDKTMRRTLARCADRGYRDKIAELCFAHALASGNVSLVLYDVTTLYFEAEHEDALRKVGYSKERRVDPQIVVGLLVDRHGFPLEIGCFEGRQGGEAHDPAGHPAVPGPARDRGHGRGRRRRHAVGRQPGRPGRGRAGVHRRLPGHQGPRRPGVALPLARRRVQRRAGHRHPHPEDRQEQGQRPRPAGRARLGPQDHPKSWRAVWAFSAKRFARDNRTLTAQENRARDVISGAKSARTPRFVKNGGGTPALDEKALARARKLAGLKGYVTNLPVSVMPPAEVISRYHDLWHVEQSFRMSKTDLAARPMFVRKRDAIEAHLTIVFTALAVARETQNRTGLAIRNVIRQLRPLRSATIAVNGAVQAFPPAIDPEQQKILDDLKNGRDLRH